MNDTTYLLVLLVPLAFVTSFLVHYILKYKKSRNEFFKLKETHDDYKYTKGHREVRFDKYIDKIKHELQGGQQLRSGFIEQSLVKSGGTNNPDEVKFDAITEVREIKRTLKRSLIEVVSVKVKNKSNKSIITISEAKSFYDGWVDSSEIEWMEVIDGREEIINDILREIEEEEKEKLEKNGTTH
jgi:hypothetical protein